jgi:hypothetical protein
MDAIWVPPERRLISGHVRSGVLKLLYLDWRSYSRLPRSIQQHENQPSWSTSSLFSSLEHLHRCSECVIILHSKIGWRKVKMCWFSSGNIFFCLRSASLQKFGGWLVKGAATLCHQHKKKKECNKFDLTAAQCFWLAYHNDWPKWFAISSSPTYLLSHCCSVFLIGLS